MSHNRSHCSNIDQATAQVHFEVYGLPYPYTDPNQYAEATRRMQGVQAIPISEAAPMPQRSHWSGGDEILLCKAWVNCSEDPIIGVDQNNKDFWIAVAKDYNAMNPAIQRNDRQCSNKFRRISMMVHKFEGHYDESRRVRPSGTADDELMTAAMTLFETHEKSVFTSIVPWRILTACNKWRARTALTPGRRGQSSSISETPIIEIADETPDFFGPDAVPRPMGQHRAKKAAREKSCSDAATSAAPTSGAAYRDGVLAKIADMVKPREREDHAKNAALQAIRDESLMRQREMDFAFLSRSMDPMDEVARHLYEKERARIIAKYSNED